MVADVNRDDLQRRRASAVKTAWILGLVAALIFAGFILTGITGR